jgi:hypothetical protein
MNIQTVKAMLEEARTNGVAEIRYNGIDGHGLASSGSSIISVFLTRYPNTAYEEEYKNFAECLKSVNKKFTPKDFLDTVEVMDGFIKVTINHLVYVESKVRREGDLECTYHYKTCRGTIDTATRCYRRGCVSSNHFSYRSEWTEYDGERLSTVLIPFENIISINC